VSLRLLLDEEGASDQRRQEESERGRLWRNLGRGVAWLTRLARRLARAHVLRGLAGRLVAAAVVRLVELFGALTYHVLLILNILNNLAAKRLSSLALLYVLLFERGTIAASTIVGFVAHVALCGDRP